MSRAFRQQWKAAVVVAALSLCAANSLSAASFTSTALKHDGTPLSGAVLTLEAIAPTLPPAAPAKAIMDQVNLSFVPDVLVVPVHSTVNFPNSDPISHQVYSFSATRKFQLPLYRGKPYPPVTFDEPGVVTLGCNIHDNMLAYIVVTGASFFGRSDARGEWTANNIAPGKYRLRLWHPLLNETKEVERIVEVTADKTTIELKLGRNLRPAPLNGRPHSWEY
jgi:plastocyanin